MIGLVDASAVAAYLGVSRDWVYENADVLGARRLGSGPKARLRFSLQDVDRRLTACPSGRESQEPAKPMVEQRKPSRNRAALGAGVELLPIRGQRAA